jgi:hypothetical protein
MEAHRFPLVASLKGHIDSPDFALLSLSVRIDTTDNPRSFNTCPPLLQKPTYEPGEGYKRRQAQRIHNFAKSLAATDPRWSRVEQARGDGVLMVNHPHPLPHLTRANGTQALVFDFKLEAAARS